MWIPSRRSSGSSSSLARVSASVFSGCSGTSFTKMPLWQGLAVFPTACSVSKMDAKTWTIITVGLASMTFAQKLMKQVQLSPTIHSTKSSIRYLSMWILWILKGMVLPQITAIYCNVDRLFARQLNAEQLSTLKSFTLAWSAAGIPWSLWSHYGIFSKFLIFSQKNKKLRIRWIYGPVILETLKSVLKLPNTFEDEEPYCTLQYHTVQTKIYCILPGSGLRNLTTPEEDDVPYVQ